MDHERRQLRLLLEKSYIHYGENIKQVVSTKIMKKVAEQKQIIKMEFELFVNDILENGADVLITYNLKLYRCKRMVVNFKRFVASNGTSSCW